MGNSNNESKFWVGFDLGGTKMYAAAFNSELKQVGSPKKTPTKGHEGPKKGVARIIETIEKTLKGAEISKSDLGGIGIGCPGVVDLKNGVLLDATNLGWLDVKIGPELSEAFGGIPVSVLNDVDAGTFGEYHVGCGSDATNLLGVFPGTGLGAGAIINGQLVSGARISCMELGNMALPSASLANAPKGSLRLEDVCSRLAIAAEAIQEAYRGGAPYLLKNFGTDLTKVKSRAIAESIENGDKAVERIVERAVHYMGMGVAAAVDMVGPDVVAVGGGLAEAMPEFFVKRLEKEVTRFAFAPLSAQAEFRLAKMGDDAVTIGAAAHCRDTHGKAA